jgi:RimJ/RimL family protein N-acetyltransferase
MRSLEYLHLQMQLEGKGIFNGCFMRQIEIVPEEELPLILIARLAAGEIITYYDEALSPDLHKELAATDIEFPYVDRLLDVLKKYKIRPEVGYFKTYVFPSRPAQEMDVICLSKHDPQTKAFEFDGFAEDVFAIDQNGALVSACVSTRENKKCGEAWVYTIAEYRHRGCAQKVVKAWARSLMDAGKVPFYSHKIDNEASASLARKLSLRPVLEEISITSR